MIPTVAFYLIFFLAFYLASDILSGDMVFGSRPALQHPELVIWCPALTPQCRKKTGVMAASERSREEGSKEGREEGRKESRNPGGVAPLQKSVETLTWPVGKNSFPNHQSKAHQTPIKWFKLDCCEYCGSGGSFRIW